MSKKTMTPTEERQEQKNETNEMILAEDAVHRLQPILPMPRTVVLEPNGSAMFSECLVWM